MKPATSRRLQAYLSSLATTTGLVASSGATIVNIDVSGMLPPTGGKSVNFDTIPGQPDLYFAVINAYVEKGNSSSLLIIGDKSYSAYPGFAMLQVTDSPSPVPQIFHLGQTIGESPFTNLYGGFFLGVSRTNNSGEPSRFTAPAFGAGSYLGFTDGKNNYGWLEVTWDPTQGVLGELDIISGAFNDNGSIVAGEVSAIPEPGNLLALSGLVGSAMFLRNRRRKNAA